MGKLTEALDSMGNVDEMIERTLGKEILPVKLTDSDRLEQADRIVKAQEEVERLESDKKAAVDEFKASISENAAVISHCIRELRRGAHDIEVEVATIKDYRTGSVRRQRLDTDEVIAERPMTEAERQLSLKKEFEGE